jgi:phosphoribosylformylglycinamidine (FGAM) synthase PurS component
MHATIYCKKSYSFQSPTLDQRKVQRKVQHQTQRKIQQMTAHEFSNPLIEYYEHILRTSAGR